PIMAAAGTLEERPNQQRSGAHRAKQRDGLVLEFPRACVVSCLMGELSLQPCATGAQKWSGERGRQCRDKRLRLGDRGFVTKGNCRLDAYRVRLPEGIAADAGLAARVLREPQRLL